MDTKNLKFSNHLIERLRERNIKKEWLLDAIQHPDDKYDTPQKLDSKLRYDNERKNSIFNKKNYVHNKKKIQ